MTVMKTDVARTLVSAAPTLLSAPPSNSVFDRADVAPLAYPS